MSEALRSAQGIISPFDTKGSDTGERWPKWISTFEYYLDASHVTKERDKLNHLFALGGSELQEIYKYATPHREEIDTFKPPLLEIPVYRNCLLRLEKHFRVDQHKIGAKTKFRNITQEVDEPFNSFLVRLQSQADKCNFGSGKDAEIMYQISQNAR